MVVLKEISDIDDFVEAESITNADHMSDKNDSSHNEDNCDKKDGSDKEGNSDEDDSSDKKDQEDSIDEDDKRDEDDPNFHKLPLAEQLSKKLEKSHATAQALDARIAKEVPNMKPETSSIMNHTLPDSHAGLTILIQWMQMLEWHINSSKKVLKKAKKEKVKQMLEDAKNEKLITIGEDREVEEVKKMFKKTEIE